MPNVSIVIPIYNEEQILENSISDLVSKLHLSESWAELILVENGSTDKTAFIAKKLAQKIPFVRPVKLAKPALGEAIKRGILQSKGRYIVLFNADFWDREFFKQALELLKGCDAVISSKTSVGSADLRPWYRRLSSRVFNQVLRLLFQFPYSSTYGVMAFKKEKITKIAKECRSRLVLFEPELLIRAHKNGLIIIKELPITLREIRPSRFFRPTLVKNAILDLYSILASR